METCVTNCTFPFGFPSLSLSLAESRRGFRRRRRESTVDRRNPSFLSFVFHLSLSHKYNINNLYILSLVSIIISSDFPSILSSSSNTLSHSLLGDYPDRPSSMAASAATALNSVAAPSKMAPICRTISHFRLSSSFSSAFPFSPLRPIPPLQCRWSSSSPSSTGKFSTNL